MSTHNPEHGRSQNPDHEKASYSGLAWQNDSINVRRHRLASKLLFLFKPLYIIRFAKILGYALTPQLLRSLIWNDHPPAGKKFPTSYLNGLRGVTAVKVFTFHYTMAYSDFCFAPWGTDERHNHILELPILRYFYSGFTSNVFFGIAGYLTSLRLFQILEKHDQASQSKVFVNISGSLFRRGFRLYLPVFAITLLTAMYIHLGFYERQRGMLMDHPGYFPGTWNEPKPPMYPTLLEQLTCWAHEMFELTNITTDKTVFPDHDQHLWSILSEMRASLHLYGCLIATLQCQKYARLACMILLTILYFSWDQWETWVYLLGAVIAQVDVIMTDWDRQKQQPRITEKQGAIPTAEPRTQQLPKYDQPSSFYISQPLTPFQPYLRYFGFFVAFYFLSYPIEGARDYAPGYMTLNLLIPEWMARKDKFYPNIGTALLIFILVRSDPQKSRWRKFLTGPIPQYLGRISFALYLVHGLIMHAIGYLVPHWIWWSMGTEGVLTTQVPWAFAVTVGWAVSLTLSLWAADVWTREVEGRCIKLVKALEERCFVKN